MVVRREHDHPPNNAMCTKEKVMSTMRKHALIQATALNFPNTNLSLKCYYHFKQAIWRNIQSLGLVEEYKSSDEVC